MKNLQCNLYQEKSFFASQIKSVKNIQLPWLRLGLRWVSLQLSPDLLADVEGARCAHSPQEPHPASALWATSPVHYCTVRITCKPEYAGPLSCFDGPLTIRKLRGTEGAALGPSLLAIVS